VAVVGQGDLAIELLCASYCHRVATGGHLIDLTGKYPPENASIWPFNDQILLEKTAKQSPLSAQFSLPLDLG
jgi:hypothetical protein